MSRMTRAGARLLFRFAAAGVVLVAVTFVMVHLIPGDPVRAIAGPNADPSAVEERRAALGLDDPLIDQFGIYVRHVVTGDLGISFQTTEPVSTIVRQGAVPTLEVVGIAAGLAVVVGMMLGALGSLAGSRNVGWATRVFDIATGSLSGLPHYLSATVLAFVFAVSLNWFPIAGTGELRFAVLPALAVAIRPIAIVARVVRTEMMATLEQPYVATARSKRLPPHLVARRYVFRNSLTGLLGIASPIVAGMVTASVIVEVLFSRRGLGSSLIDAVLIGDYPVVQGLVLVLGLSIVGLNALIDFMVGVVDPRVRQGLS